LKIEEIKTKNDSFFIEENVTLKTYGSKISKKLEVFYNPKMKLNRDISHLVLYSYFKDFKKKINFCDPMCASGIREIRFLKNEKII
jgi:tRNA G26 N,N-dimethylase Trm1